MSRCEELVGDDDRIGTLALGEGDRHGRAVFKRPRSGPRQGPGAVVGLGRADDHVRDVLDIDRAPVAGGQQQQPDIRHALQCLAGDDRDVLVDLLEGADQERAIGVFSLSTS